MPNLTRALRYAVLGAHRSLNLRTSTPNISDAFAKIPKP